MINITRSACVESRPVRVCFEDDQQISSWCHVSDKQKLLKIRDCSLIRANESSLTSNELRGFMLYLSICILERQNKDMHNNGYFYWQAHSHHPTLSLSSVASEQRMRSRREERERKVEIISVGDKNKENVPVPQQRRGLALAGNLKNHYSWIVIGSDLKRPRASFCEKIDTRDQLHYLAGPGSPGKGRGLVSQHKPEMSGSDTKI